MYLQSGADRRAKDGTRVHFVSWWGNGELFRVLTIRLNLDEKGGSFLETWLLEATSILGNAVTIIHSMGTFYPVYFQNSGLTNDISLSFWATVTQALI